METTSRGRLSAALACIGFAAVALSAKSAAADWQYTQWGMSPAEVLAASEGAATANQDRGLDADGLKAELVAPFPGEKLPFTAVFLFGIRDRLAAVALTPQDRAACGQIADILKTHYGAPLASEGADVAKSVRWNDYGNDNVVTFLSFGARFEGGCSIEYSKLLNTRNDGTL